MADPAELRIKAFNGIHGAWSTVIPVQSYAFRPM